MMRAVLSSNLGRAIRRSVVDHQYAHFVKTVNRFRKRAQGFGEGNLLVVAGYLDEKFGRQNKKLPKANTQIAFFQRK